MTNVVITIILLVIVYVVYLLNRCLMELHNIKIDLSCKHRQLHEYRQEYYKLMGRLVKHFIKKGYVKLQDLQGDNEDV